MEKIIDMLLALKEDKPQIIITDEIIKDYIEENIEVLIDEIQREL